MAKQLIGIVTSTGMKNTVVVEVPRFIKHPKYQKIMKRNTVLKADSNSLEISKGDKVRIEEIAPVSRGKNFKVIKKI